MKVWLASCLLLCVVGFVSAQPPIPLSSSLFTRGDGNAPIKLEAFIDLQCPDSKAVWPVLLALAQYYGPQKMQLTATLFPLPYHHNAFFAAQAAVVVTELANNSSKFWDLAQVFFNEQNNWGDVATQSITPLQVIRMMSQYAQTCCGTDPKAFENAMGWVSSQNLQARVTWKRAASLGIYGTPMFVVNGVTTAADESWNFSKWRSLLDPLLP